MTQVPAPYLDVDIDTDNPSSLDKADLARAIERGLLTELQLNELGLDTPEKVQAALRHEEPAYNPATMPASGSHMNLTEEEVAIIEERRAKAEADAEAGKNQPKIKTLDAKDDEEDDGEEVPYEEWTNDELRAEIVSRNEGRDEADHLSVSGNKADLIATLEGDDNE